MHREEFTMGKVWVIGIAGGTASGKTTIVNRLKEYFKDDIRWGMTATIWRMMICRSRSGAN